METHRSIDLSRRISRRIYASLLYLYPREHRAAYGADMLQLFTDQCRSVRTRLGFMALWLRTLFDLVTSALREQLSVPHRTLGLFEAPPNAPLPWKGVALVLIPGLIFFTGQVAQLTGQDWFFLLVYRGAFFLIIPVLVAWALKRKFPIWGLMPLGLLVRTVMSLGYNVQFMWEQRLKQLRDALSDLNRAFDLPVVPYEVMRVVVMISITLICLGLVVWLVRRAGISRRAWAWLGIYVLLVAATIGLRCWRILSINDPTNNPAITPLTLLSDYGYGYLLDFGGFLALILAGGLLARRHGRLAALLPLGYLMPTVLFGRFFDSWPEYASPTYTVLIAASVSALIYRFVVALAGPLWIVRSATGQMQQRSSAISLILLVAIQAACNVAILFYYYGEVKHASSIYFAIADQLITVAGIVLALALYRPLAVEPKRPADLQVVKVLEG